MHQLNTHRCKAVGFVHSRKKQQILSHYVSGSCKNWSRPAKLLEVIKVAFGRIKTIMFISFLSLRRCLTLRLFIAVYFGLLPPFLSLHSLSIRGKTSRDTGTAAFSTPRGITGRI